MTDDKYTLSVVSRTRNGVFGHGVGVPNTRHYQILIYSFIVRKGTARGYEPHLADKFSTFYRIEGEKNPRRGRNQFLSRRRPILGTRHTAVGMEQTKK